jgi:hypothetical protein
LLGKSVRRNFCFCTVKHHIKRRVFAGESKMKGVKALIWSIQEFGKNGFGQLADSDAISDEMARYALMLETAMSTVS